MKKRAFWRALTVLCLGSAGIVCTFALSGGAGATSSAPTIELRKVLKPASDTGSFSPSLDNSSFGPFTGGGPSEWIGTSGAVTVAPGSHTVTESGAGGTDLSSYTRQIFCSSDGSGSSAKASGSTSVVFSVKSGDKPVCTLTNVRTQSVTNPNLEKRCGGLKILVVLDESGSIKPATTQVHDAVSGFLDDLVGTGSYVGMTKFSTFASSSTVPYTEVDSSSVNGAFKSYLDGYAPDGWTNWEDGLKQANTYGTPDLVLFFTDGNPNTWLVPFGSGSISDGSASGLDTATKSAVLQAKILTDKGAHMFVVGVKGNEPDALDINRIQQVSGPDEWNGSPTTFASADYVTVDNFTNLGDTLAEIVSALCASSVTVTKMVYGPDSPNGAPAPGWTMSATVKVTSGNKNVDWLDPADGVVTTDPNGSTKSKPTGDDGAAFFQFKPDQASVSKSSVAIAETQRSGYDYAGATCSVARDGGQVDQLTFGAGDPIAFDLGRKDSANCTLRNDQQTGTLQLVKRWRGAPGYVDLKAGQYTAVGPTDTAGDWDGPAWTVPTGTYDLSEMGKNGTDLSNYDTSITCNSTKGNVTQVTVVKGDRVVCTFWNTRQRATLRVEKHFVGSPTTLTITANDVSKVINSNDAVEASVEMGGTYPVSETLSDADKALYDTTLQCTGGDLQHGVYADRVQVGAKGLTCVFTNTRTTGSIVVTKHFVGADAGATATLQILSGTSTVADGSRGDGGSITANVDTGTYTIDETSADGDVDLDLYSASVVCRNGDATIAHNDSGSRVSVDVAHGAQIACEIVNTRKPSSISVDKQVVSTDPAPLTEAGGSVTYKVTVTNTSGADSVTLTTLDDSAFGNIADSDNPKLTATTCDLVPPVVLAAGASYSCTFTVFLKVSYGSDQNPHVNTVTATGHDEEGNTLKGSDSASVEVADVPSSITVVKTPTPASVVEPGGTVKFTVVVRNDSATDSVTINSLVDDVYGNLNDGVAPEIDCGLPFVISPGASKTCSFEADVNGAGGTSHTDTVTATGKDDDGNAVTDDGSAVVHITSQSTPPVTPQPPVPPVDKKINLVVTKTDSPDPVTVGKTLTYTIRVVNQGPDYATGVRLADPAPTGVVFLTVATTQGTCSGTSALVQCQLGTLAPGASAVITIVSRPTQTGTFINRATATGNEKETNDKDNTGEAQTLVVGTVTPPTPKPKPTPTPKAKAQACKRLWVAPKMIKANGSAQVISAKVTQSRNPKAGVTVRVIGPGIDKKGKTGADGVVILSVTPRQAGIVKVAIRNSKSCDTQRIGVVGAFEPPVTG